MEKIDIVEQRIAELSSDLLELLLRDKTTGKYILWATDNYEKYGESYYPDHEITPALIIGENTNIIQPRVMKALTEQIRRTRDKAEVFTPSWICNQQNNLIDSAWFGRENVFNTTTGTVWEATDGNVTFPEGKTWMDYVDARRLEVSCGEAPYLVSRYDTVSGAAIFLRERIGLLDRKLRVVCENASTDEEWVKWVARAFQSVYGYEFSGDNVLLARENLMLTYMDYYESRFDRTPSLSELKKIATIISWNIWQMDGIKLTVPYTLSPPKYTQMFMLDIADTEPEDKSGWEEVYCRVYDWRAKESLEFRSMVRGGQVK